MTTHKRQLSEFAEPGMGGPEMGVPSAAPSAEPAGAVIGHHGEGPDREGAMAKADLYKLASYSHKLYQQIQDDSQLEAWVQAKITKAADYIASVYHFMEYEMKFSEYGHHLDNSDTLSEGQKMRLKELLSEAKGKVKELKMTQAEKVSPKVNEGTLTGGDAPCDACGGTGVVHNPGMAVPDHVKSKVAAYNRQAKAMHAASKRLDANNNGIPDEDEMEESTEEFGAKETASEKKAREARATTSKKSSTGGTTTTSPGKVTHKAGKNYGGGVYESEEFGAPETAKEKKEREARETTTKKSSTGGTTTKSPGKVTHTAGKNYSGKMSEASEEFGAPETAKEKKEREARETTTKKSSTGGTTTKSPGKVTHKAGKNYSGKMSEASKPSAGLSKAKKSAVVKKAKAGGDIGKPGKNFDKVAKAGGGGEKGEKIAAAAMWKNVKETTAYMMEKAAAAKKADSEFAALAEPKDKVTFADKIAGAKKNEKKTVKESTDFSRMQEQLGRLNRSESHQLVESSEADQIRALSKRLLG